jgi:curved DNA-binding protein CbpA
MSSTKANAAPSKDPYEVLGLAFGVTDTEIAKAYRNLARTLHPDKLVSQNLSQHELKQAAVRFQDIQIARSFLLDVDNIEARRRYDTKFASDQVRRNADKAREAGMSERRKRMRDELKQYEEEAAAAASRKNVGPQSQRHSSASMESNQQRSTKSKLAREGMKMREKYAAKEEVTKQQECAQAVIALQRRQIRLKWSRKRLQVENIPSPSEDSIAKMLSISCGGSVEQVKMLGDKGNAALVTFVHETSCDVAVQLYRTSETWRAVYIDKDKQKKEESKVDRTISSSLSQRDHEDVHEWKERQASEREALLQQMEQNDNESPIEEPKVRSVYPFPPSFPDEYISSSGDCDALDCLERLENVLLKGIVSDVVIQQMKVVR